MTNKYTYQDSAGTKHATTTNTGPGTIETGAAIREQILDAGDFSGQLRDTDDGPYWDTKLGIGPMGSGRG